MRLRLLRTDKVDEAQFHITSLQDEQSEIILSSGNITVDLLHRHKNLEEKGILHILLVGVASSVLVSFFYFISFNTRVIINVYKLEPNNFKIYIYGW